MTTASDTQRDMLTTIAGLSRDDARIALLILAASPDSGDQAAAGKALRLLVSAARNPRYPALTARALRDIEALAAVITERKNHVD